MTRFLFLPLLALSAFGALPERAAFGDFFEGLRFERPVFFAEIPGRPSHYLILEQHLGRATVVSKSEGRWIKSPFAQVKVAKANEMGLLGFAFHPRFAENRKVYLHYNPDFRTSLIEERTADSTFLRDAGQKPREILRVAQPYANHNGGTIAFGRDGFLTIGFGDGGSGGDPENRAQNPMSLLGKFLRIDVDRPAPGKAYSVPIDNPFVGKAGVRPEIWALGLRNPWKWTFHPETGELWAGDVGQGTGEWTGYEEISIVPKGGNMGWKVVEGAHCFPPGTRKCDTIGMTPPLLELPRRQAVSITGGAFYRFDKNSPLYDAYVFGDYGTGRIWALRAREGRVVEQRQIGELPEVSSFGVDSQGRVFALSLEGGVYIVEAGAQSRNR